MAIDYQSSFNSGELSGRMNGRSSLEVYKNGCSRLENFFVLPQGGVERRTGTEYIASTNGGAGDGRARMIPFIFSSTQSYAVEFGDGYITVWDDDTPILVTNSSPYADADLDDIDVRQRFDIMYIQHPDFPIYELRRINTNPSFELKVLEFDYPPLDDQNDEEIYFDLTFNETAYSAAGVSYSVGDVVQYDGIVFRCVYPMTSSNFNTELGKGWWIASNKGATATINSYDSASGGLDADAFNDGMVGSVFSIKNQRNGILNTDGSVIPWNSPEPRNRVNENSTTWASGTANESFVSGMINASLSNWEYNISGSSFKGTINIQRSLDNGVTFEDYVFITTTPDLASKSLVFSSPSPEGVNTWLRVSNIDWSSTGSMQFDISAQSSDIEGLVLVTGFTDENTITVEVISDVQCELSTGITGLVQTSTPTRIYYPTRSKKWSGSSFSSSKGWSRAISFHQDRLWLAGNDAEPSTIFASVSGDYYNFAPNETSDGGIKRIPDNPEFAQWFVGKDKLVMGTEGGAVGIRSVDSRELIDASNIVTSSQAVFGASAVPAIEANDVVVYSERSGKKLRELIYNDTEENFRSSDMNILNNEILVPGVKELFLQQQPDQVIWAVDRDGDCACLTYERVQEVVGWSRFITNGTIESACRIPSSTSEDEIWFCVNRGGVYTIEKLRPRADANWYVDSGVESVIGGVQYAIDASGERAVDASGEYALDGGEIEGLSHLNGQEVRCVADGVDDGLYTVVGGKITPSTQDATTYLVGLDYDSIMRTMPIEPNLMSKLPNSRIKGATKCVAEFYPTQGGSIREKDKTGEILEPVEFSGEKRFNIASDWTREKIIEIKQHLPYPMTIISLAVWTEAKGG